MVNWWPLAMTPPLCSLVVMLSHFYTLNEISGYELRGPSTFASAESDCRSLGMMVATAKDRNYWKQVKNFILSHNISVSLVWLGLTYDGTLLSGDFTWSDHSSMSWTHWDPLEPNNLDTDRCVAMKTSTMMWYTRTCDDISLYVCQNIPLGPFLKRMTNQRPLGNPLVITVSVSSVQCTAHCEHTPNCDMVLRHIYNRICVLYDSFTVRMITGLPDGWRFYIRQPIII